MRNRKRVRALVLFIALSLIISVSFAYIALEAHHDCCGEDCPICRTIAVNIQVIRVLGLALLIAAAVLILRRGQTARSRYTRHISFFSGTLVSWKVRLDD